MIGSEYIPKTLRMMHEAARHSFENNLYEKGIQILNDAHVLEKKLGYKELATQSMLEIASTYMILQRYDLALWFAKEALEILPHTQESSIKSEINNLLNNIKEKTLLSALSM
jgi:hypothetical protein